MVGAETRRLDNKLGGAQGNVEVQSSQASPSSTPIPYSSRSLCHLGQEFWSDPSIQPLNILGPPPALIPSQGTGLPVTIE